MSVLANYARIRALWGAVDWQFGTGSPYSSAETLATLGTSAAAGSGVGVRRVVLHFDRTAAIAGADDAEMHFDFLNITGGAPDDTWTSTDYTTLEGYLNTWFLSVKPTISTKYVLTSYNWYRHGPGIVAPNPAERVTSVSGAGTSSSAPLPPQVACSITFRTAVRRSWGRTYLPGLTSAALDGTSGFLGSSFTATIAGATGTLFTSANGHDFPMVVTSKHLSAVLGIEQIEVDNVADIIRRRRWKHATAKNFQP